LAPTIIVEFTTPEDANKVIDEGLIWQGEPFQCERYDRQCRLKQCYKCQKYGHIGTQCKANTACGYCAETHSSKDCPSKVDKSAIRKCAVCKGAHEVWNNRCPVRKVELSKAKAAYDARQPYHFVPPAKERLPMEHTIIDATPAEETAMISATASLQHSQMAKESRKPKQRCSTCRYEKEIKCRMLLKYSRRRRILCDKKLPNCQNCLDSGRICRGRVGNVEDSTLCPSTSTRPLDL
jgi:hypothetical protein